MVPNSPQDNKKKNMMIARLANTKLVSFSNCQKRQGMGFLGGQNLSDAFMQLLYFHDGADDDEYDR